MQTQKDEGEDAAKAAWLAMHEASAWDAAPASASQTPDTSMPPPQPLQTQKDEGEDAAKAAWLERHAAPAWDAAPASASEIHGADMPSSPMHSAQAEAARPAWLLEHETPVWRHTASGSDAKEAGDVPRIADVFGAEAEDGYRAEAEDGYRAVAEDGYRAEAEEGADVDARDWEVADGPFGSHETVGMAWEAAYRAIETQAAASAMRHHAGIPEGEVQPLTQSVARRARRVGERDASAPAQNDAERWQRESREFFDSRNRRIGRARPDASTWQQESRGGTGNIGRGRDVALRARRVGERDAAQVQNDAERWQRETRAGVGNRRGRNGRAKTNASAWQQESRGSTGNIARSIGAPTPASSSPHASAEAFQDLAQDRVTEGGMIKGAVAPQDAAARAAARALGRHRA